jgi:hypothetical protein
MRMAFDVMLRIMSGVVVIVVVAVIVWRPEEWFAV